MIVKPMHLFVIFLNFGLLAACHLTYTVRNQNNTLQDFLYFPCGYVSFELIGKGNSKFTFTQHFFLNEDVQFLSKSIVIQYNDREIQLKTASNNSKDIAVDYIVINRNKVIENQFVLEGGVFEGDTIKIFARDYLRCRGQVIDLDTLVFSFTNNIRIYGINE